MNLYSSPYAIRTTYLNKLIDALNAFTNSDFLSDDKIFTTKEDYEAIIKAIEEFQETPNICFNLSVIEGEYYQTQDALELIEIIQNTLLKLSEKLRRSIQKIEKLKEPYIKSSPTIDKINSDLNNADNFLFYLKALSSAIGYFEKQNSYYGYFIGCIDDRLEQRATIRYDNGIEYGLKFLSEEIVYVDANIRGKVSPYIKYSYYLFLINIKLAEIDEGYGGYECSSSHFSSLRRYTEALNSFIENGFAANTSPIITNILLDKSQFLTQKLFLRDPYEQGRTEILHTGLKTYRLSSNSNTQNIFNFFRDKSRRHYDIQEYKKEGNDYLRSIISKVERQKLDELKIEDVHFLCKYIKNSIENIYNSEKPYSLKTIAEIILNIHNYYLEKFRLDEVLTDKYAIESALNLTASTMLKLEIKNSLMENSLFMVGTVTELVIEMEKRVEYLLALNGKRTLPNLHIYNSFIFYLLDLVKILKDMSKHQSISDTQAYFRELDKVSKIFLKYSGIFKKKVEWCRKEGILPVYLSIQECFIPIPKKSFIKESAVITLDIHRDPLSANDQLINPTINIFLDSSYILPSNYETFLSNINDTRVEFDSIETEILRYAAKLEMATQKDVYDKKFDEKAKENQYNAVQMIGLYAAIITFVLGSAVVITKLPPTEVVLEFLFVYAGALGFFVLLLRLIFLPIKITRDAFDISKGFRKNFKNSIRYWLSSLNWPVAIYYVIIIVISIVLIFCGTSKIASFSKQQKTFVRQEYLIRMDSVNAIIMSLNYQLELDSILTNKKYLSSQVSLDMRDSAYLKNISRLDSFYKIHLKFLINEKINVQSGIDSMKYQ